MLDLAKLVFKVNIFLTLEFDMDQLCLLKIKFIRGKNMLPKSATFRPGFEVAHTS